MLFAWSRSGLTPSMCICSKLHQCEISQNKRQWIRSLFELLFLLSLAKFSRTVAIPGSCVFKCPGNFLGPWLSSLGYFWVGIVVTKFSEFSGNPAHPWVPALFICSHLCMHRNGFKQTSDSILPAGWFLCSQVISGRITRQPVEVQLFLQLFAGEGGLAVFCSCPWTAWQR